MRTERRWFYRNPVAHDVPDDIDELSIEQKNQILENWNGAVRTENIQTIDQKLLNIRAISCIDTTDLEKWVMDRLKEATDHFINGYWLSSIAVCACICEYLSFLYIEEYINENGIDEIIGNTRRLSDQNNRLLLLRNLNLVNEVQRTQLDQIRGIRNRYIHLNRINEGEEIRNASLLAINTLINYLNGRVT